MNRPLVSAIIPTRKRVPRLIKTIDSLLREADDKSCVEVVLKIDNDDQITQKEFPFADYPMVKKVFSDRGRGYGEMGRFVTEACAGATGEWSFLIDDDCWIVGKGWDSKLNQVPKDGAVAQCEFYHLGGSRYGSGSCGPNGLFFPTGKFNEFGIKQLYSPADHCLYSIFVTERKWPIHLLKEITYRHDRDSEEQLAIQASI